MLAVYISRLPSNSFLFYTKAVDCNLTIKTNSYRKSWGLCVFQKRLKNHSEVAFKEPVIMEKLLQGFLGEQGEKTNSKQ